MNNIDMTDKVIIDLDYEEMFGGDNLEFPQKLDDFLFNKLDEISKVVRNMGAKN